MTTGIDTYLPIIKRNLRISLMNFQPFVLFTLYYTNPTKIDGDWQKKTKIMITRIGLAGRYRK